MHHPGGVRRGQRAGGHYARVMTGPATAGWRRREPAPLDLAELGRRYGA
jgi:hypothetical protein